MTSKPKSVSARASMFARIGNNILGHSDQFELPHRCYNGVCLTTSLGCLSSSVFNIFIGLQPLTIATTVFGCIFLGLYAKGRFSQTNWNMLWFYIPMGLLLLASLWILGDGINGTGTIVSMVALVALMVVVKRRRWAVLLALYFPTMSVLFLLQYLRADVILPYHSTHQRLFDVYFTFIVSTAVIYIIIELILRSYNKEKQQLETVNRLLEKKMTVLNRTNQELKQALDQVQELSGLLPICASCKKIRDDKGYWNQIELYISQHSKAEFSHGLCPDCALTYLRR